MKNLVQPVSAVALAATIATAITILPTLSDPVDASAPIKVAIAAAPVPVSSKCTEQAWPNIDADCLRDSRRSEGLAKPVTRTVGIERKAEHKTEHKTEGKTALDVASIHAPMLALTKTASPPARR
ncbi:MAG: hypothetical protein K2Y27_22120 [Xanthobacteraceae bacterium]|nr:hypothetical protein [Xanthobacteraceae bacterium]